MIEFTNVKKNENGKMAVKGVIIAIFCICLLIFSVGCDKVLGGDLTSSAPDYIEVDGEPLTFLLELREPGSGDETAEGDGFSHSTTDGKLIASWEVPMYGATVYESVVKYFDENSADKITFRLSQHRFYMFHECVLSGGEKYNLETVYVAADGKYANCANFIALLGDDGEAGTADDLKVLTLVYKGWLY